MPVLRIAVSNVDDTITSPVFTNQNELAHVLLHLIANAKVAIEDKDAMIIKPFIFTVLLDTLHYNYTS